MSSPRLGSLASSWRSPPSCPVRHRDGRVYEEKVDGWRAGASGTAKLDPQLGALGRESTKTALTSPKRLEAASSAGVGSLPSLVRARRQPLLKLRDPQLVPPNAPSQVLQVLAAVPVTDWGGEKLTLREAAWCSPPY